MKPIVNSQARQLYVQGKVYDDNGPRRYTRTDRPTFQVARYCCCNKTRLFMSLSLAATPVEVPGWRQ